MSVFAKGGYEWEGVRVDSTVVNANTLDDVGNGVDLREFTVGYWDGRRDNWEAGMGEKPFPGGCY